MIETLLASRLTTTTNFSSGVRAIVVERVGAASAFDATRTEKTAAADINSNVPPQAAILRKSKIEV
jgi:hypothetical protein